MIQTTQYIEAEQKSRQVLQIAPKLTTKTGQTGLGSKIQVVGEKVTHHIPQRLQISEIWMDMTTGISTDMTLQKTASYFLEYNNTS